MWCNSALITIWPLGSRWWEFSSDPFIICTAAKAGIRFRCVHSAAIQARINERCFVCGWSSPDELVISKRNIKYILVDAMFWLKGTQQGDRHITSFDIIRNVAAYQRVFWQVLWVWLCWEHIFWSNRRRTNSTTNIQIHFTLSTCQAQLTDRNVGG